jgi:hypothetical protein
MGVVSISEAVGLLLKGARCRFAKPTKKKEGSLIRNSDQGSDMGKKSVGF